ncbi:MAG: PQQ-binding-like beta-propeller repeat protein [Thermodesulfobacteriota bacterium]
MRARSALRAPLRAVCALLVLAAACSDAPPPASSSPSSAGAWTMYGGGFDRTFFNPHETLIDKETVAKLVPLWRFTTGAVVTASPVVSDVELPGEGTVEALFIPSWDGNLYALRTRDGTPIWTFRFKPHPGASYPQASSGAIADVDGRRLLYVGSGMTMYCVDASTGALVWEFDAGTGCEICDFLTERNEILSSPAVFEGAVYFGMDLNDFGDGKGGFYGVDARLGTLLWYFDLETGATCRPNEGDDVRRYDGYHSAEELGLPEDFFATRPGCDHDRAGTACGNVWSSATIDVERRLIYSASSNCDTDDDPATPDPPPPMPPYDEALFALRLDGTPAWVWRPREVDNDDLAIGGVPNLFEIEIGGRVREVVGVGVKDGTYYVLDRDGVNGITGRIEPYWQTNVVPGGDIGGIIASAAVGEGKVLFSTAVGTDIANPQKPAAWGLRAGDGAVLWSNPDALPSFGPTTAIPGVVFMGSIGGSVFAYDSDTGAELARLGVGGPASSAPVMVGGRLYVGAGTGARGGSPAEIAFQTSLIPSPVSAFCIAGSDGCPESGSCDDGNTCTVDQTAASGTCENLARPDGTECTVGAFDGRCTEGVCILDEAICDDQNQCTEDVSGPGGCRFTEVPDGTPCVVRDDAGTCQEGRCVKS